MNIRCDQKRNGMKGLMAVLVILAEVAGGMQTASAGDQQVGERRQDTHRRCRQGSDRQGN
jgi:hypothetical protein